MATVTEGKDRGTGDELFPYRLIQSWTATRDGVFGTEGQMQAHPKIICLLLTCCDSLFGCGRKQQSRLAIDYNTYTYGFHTSRDAARAIMDAGRQLLLIQLQAHPPSCNA